MNTPKIHLQDTTTLSPSAVPSTPESAALRITRNLGKFSLYYAIFVWTVLFITLVPKRKGFGRMFGCDDRSDVVLLSFAARREFPNSAWLHKIIDKRIVILVLFVVASIELILTKAGIHLLVTLPATIPVVLVHAVLSKCEGVFVGEEGGEMASLVQEELDGAAQPQNLV